jgi:hypothetical protein
MNTMFFMLIVLFGLKLLWNILTPYVAERRYRIWQNVGGEKPGPISTVLIAEVFILLFIALFSVVLNENVLGVSPFYVFIYGGCFIVASYLLAMLVGFLSGKINKIDA